MDMLRAIWKRAKKKKRRRKPHYAWVRKKERTQKDDSASSSEALTHDTADAEETENSSETTKGANRYTRFIQSNSSKSRTQVAIYVKRSNGSHPAEAAHAGATDERRTMSVLKQKKDQMVRRRHKERGMAGSEDNSHPSQDSAETPVPRRDDVSSEHIQSDGETLATSDPLRAGPTSRISERRTEQNGIGAQDNIQTMNIARLQGTMEGNGGMPFGKIGPGRDGHPFGQRTPTLPYPGGIEGLQARHMAERIRDGRGITSPRPSEPSRPQGQNWECDTLEV